MWVDRFERLPAWAQPPVAGALILACLTVIRAVFRLPAMLADPRLILAALMAIVAASAAGAIGGLAYSLVGRRLRRIPTVGRYLAGMVCVAAYLLPLLLVLPPSGRGAGFTLSDPVGAAIAGFLILLFGIVVGHTWFEEPRRPRRS